MVDTFYESLSKPVSLEFPSVEIHDVREAGKPPANALVPGPYGRPYAGERRDSRQEGGPEKGRLEPRWKLALEESVSPRFVLQVGDRVLVQGQGNWKLVDARVGRALASGSFGASDIAMENDGSFYSILPSGYIEARDGDGKVLHLCQVRLAEGFTRLFLARRGPSYLVASLSDGRPPFGIGDMWAVEKIGLGDTSKREEDGVLLDQRKEGLLIRKTPLLLTPPSHDGMLVLASEGRVYFLDDNLRIVRALTGDFEPVSLSLDESGTLYLVVRDASGSHLWRITAKGERLTKVDLPEAFVAPTQPPIVDGTHRIYLVSPAGILALDSDGKTAWRRLVRTAGQSGPFATALGGGRLAVALGDSLLSFGRDGAEETLFTFPSESVRTPPVLDQRQRIYVATDRTLYCLHVAR